MSTVAYKIRPPGFLSPPLDVRPNSKETKTLTAILDAKTDLQSIVTNLLNFAVRTENGKAKSFTHCKQKVTQLWTPNNSDPQVKENFLAAENVIDFLTKGLSNSEKNRLLAKAIAKAERDIVPIIQSGDRNNIEIALNNIRTIAKELGLGGTKLKLKDPFPSTKATGSKTSHPHRKNLHQPALKWHYNARPPGSVGLPTRDLLSD